MLYNFRTFVSSDAPSDFRLKHIPVRHIVDVPTGRKPRPLESTRMSKQNPFSYIDSYTPARRRQLTPVEERTHAMTPDLPYSKAPPVITKELCPPATIVRTDFPTLKQARLRVQRLRLNPLHSVGKTPSPAKPIERADRARSLTRMKKPKTRRVRKEGTTQIGWFEGRLASIISSQARLTTHEKYAVS